MVAGVLIEHFGCSPVTGASNAAALTRLHREQRVDLVVVDVPADEGDEAADGPLLAMLACRGSVPVIALTHDAASARKTDGIVSLAKPYSPRELHAAMAKALLGFAAPMLGTA
jgi:CheY-like chemotaxis protein